MCRSGGQLDAAVERVECLDYLLASSKSLRRINDGFIRLGGKGRLYLFLSIFLSLSLPLSLYHWQDREALTSGRLERWIGGLEAEG